MHTTGGLAWVAQVTCLCLAEATDGDGVVDAPGCLPVKGREGHTDGTPNLF